MMMRSKTVRFERVEHSHGVGFEGELEKLNPFVVATSCSFIQLLFHHPLLFLKKRIRLDNVTVFGAYESLVDNEFFCKLLDFLAEGDDFFFFKANKKRWFLDLDGVYEGQVLDDLETFFNTYF